MKCPGCHAEIENENVAHYPAPPEPPETPTPAPGAPSTPETPETPPVPPTPAPTFRILTPLD